MSTPNMKGIVIDKIICRSAMSIISIMTDYAKFSGLFKKHKHIIIDDCGFIINIWIFTLLLKFTPLKWIKQVADFRENKFPMNPDLKTIEELHSLFIFKFKFRAIKKFLFNFNLQFLTRSNKFQTYYKGFVEKILKD